MALASKFVSNNALSLVILVSATFALGRRGDLPKVTACISESTRVPAAATVGVALLIAVGVCVRDVKLTLSFSTFTVLVYYVITNL